MIELPGQNNATTMTSLRYAVALLASSALTNARARFVNADGDELYAIELAP